MVKTVLKHNKYHSIRFAISELAGKDARRLVCLYDPPDSRNITIHIFQYDVGGHVRGGILDLNVKMVSEHS